MRCLAELPAEQREIIVLKIWHHYTFEAIGELLDVSPNTAAAATATVAENQARLEGEVYERDEHIGDAIAVLGTAPPVGDA